MCFSNICISLQLSQGILFLNIKNYAFYGPRTGVEDNSVNMLFFTVLNAISGATAHCDTGEHSMIISFCSFANGHFTLSAFLSFCNENNQQGITDLKRQQQF